jgi:putative NADH-flavin reductase
MKILVLGATGGIGKQVVRQALDQGHEVTILARDPNKLDVSLHRIRCIEGDVLNPASVEAAITGNDVVVSALGVPPRQRSGDLIKQCVPIVIEAMRRHGLRRLIFTSGIVVKTHQLSFVPRLVMRLIMRRELLDQVADKQAGEKILRESGMAWTLLYPVILTDGPLTGRYRFGEDIKLRGLPKVSRADVADLILKLASEAPSVNRELFVSN